MSEQENSAEDRNLPASEKRLKDAREEGRVARSKELASFLLLGAALIFSGRRSAPVGVVVAVVMIPLLLVGAYRLLPKTRFGRNVILSGPVRERGDAIPDTAELLKLLGQVGHVLTPLRPVGTCDFSGRRVECVAEAGYVQKGATVKVIRVEGTQLTVRVTDEA